MKKALALFLVLVLAFSMSTIAFAAPKVNKDVTKQVNVKWAGSLLTAKDYDLGDLEPNGSKNVVTIQLSQDNFVEADATDPFVSTATYGNPANPAGMTVLAKKIHANKSDYSVDITGAGNKVLSTADIKASRMSVKFKASKGSQVIDEVALSSKDSEVTVKFAEPFKSNNTDGVDFEFKVYLVVDGKQWTDLGVTFYGNYKNKVDEDYDADTDWYDFSEGSILKPAEFIRMFEGDMGEGVIVNMRGLKNSKYWGVADQNMTDADQDLLIKYASIDAIYNLPNIGIASVANFVTLEDADPTAYVYDGELNYLGRGNSNLPFSEKYFLSAVELALDEDEGEEPFEDEDELGDGELEEEEEDYIPGGENAEGGGDDLYPDNVNDNPGTGK